MKLVYKILFAIVLPITFISIMFIYFIYNMMYKEVEDRFINGVENTTNSYTDIINLKLNTVSQNTLYLVKKLEANTNLGEEEVYHLLNDILIRDAEIYGASVFFDSTYNGELNKTFIYVYTDDHGVSRVGFNSSQEQYREYFNRNFNWWKIPKSSGHAIWTSPYYDEGAGNKLMITYAHPFFIDGEYAGVVSVDVLVENINKLLSNNKSDIESRYNPDLFVINSEDSVVIFSERGEIGNEDSERINDSLKIVYDTKAKLSVLDLILKLKNGSGIVRNNKGQRFFVFYSQINSCGWFVINMLDVSVAQAYVYKSIRAVIIITALFIFILVLMIFVTGKLITSPISKLSDLTVEISKGNYEKAVSSDRNDEIGTLYNNFKLMATKLMEREQSLVDANKQLMVLDKSKNEFLKIISHEIRTPLNGIIGSTYFLNDMISDPELKEFLDMLKDSGDRLDRFSKIALEITEMRTVGEKVAKTSFRAEKIILQVIDTCAPLADKKGLTVSANLCDEEIYCVETYFERSFEELLKNAIKFSNPDSEIKVYTFVSSNKLNLRVANTGEMIPPDKISEITKPFGLGKEHFDQNIGKRTVKYIL